MTFSFLRRPAALALALGLAVAGCGGKAEFEVKGVITGLKYDGLVLVNNGGNDLKVAANATTFVFPGTIEYGTPYNVTVKTPPLHSTCTPSNFTDSAGRQATINVEISCGLTPHTLGGTVTGLTAEGLELNNGSEDRIAIASGATSYAFAGKIPFATSYSVTILKQPTGLKCSVSNQGGEMGDVDIANINVSCVPA